MTLLWRGRASAVAQQEAELLPESTPRTTVPNIHIRTVSVCTTCIMGCDDTEQ